MSEDVRKWELAPLQSIRDNYEKPCCPLSLVLMLLTTVSNPKTLSTGCLTNKHCIFKGNLKFFVVHVWNICELNTFGVANRHNWRFKASVHMSRCFSFAYFEGEWFKWVSFRGYSNPRDKPQNCMACSNIAFSWVARPPAKKWLSDSLCRWLPCIPVSAFYRRTTNPSIQIGSNTF